MKRIIIPGEPEPGSENKLITAEMFRWFARDQLERMKEFDANRRVRELRLSCGIESEPSFITIRRPPRYCKP